MGPRPNRPQQRPSKRPAVSTAAELKLALAWREAWRNDKARRSEPAETEKPGAKAATRKPDGEENKRRARFAAGIARSEFGRSYWDARREAGRLTPPP